MPSEKINLVEKLSQFSDHWAPRTVAQLNEYDIMVVKVQGEFVWHAHADTDDFFLVLQGRLRIQLRPGGQNANPHAGHETGDRGATVGLCSHRLP
jgi:mannose-6-phosphate isomerase-like protein (cupin superfamily)